MKYTVEPKIFELNPELQFGIIIGRGLNNGESSDSDAQQLKEAENKVRETIKAEELRMVPNIKEYREVMQKSGINPNRFPPSTEAMVKRIIKGSSLPNINALVDLCNAVSLEKQISLGGHDLKDIHEDLSVRFSKGSEIFLPFGSTEVETVEENELIFTSGEAVQTRKWIWRQSELGKMTADTKDVFFQLVGFDGEIESLMSAMDSVEKLVVDRFAGSCERFLVTKNQNSIEFEI
ncbi:B3/B4 domain-containing protein [Alkalibacter mobilis]|uniref:B3/B4 domain-containing protein n=1 Tax=Alkalibacter mobilis TaxID=2787712 RepID=UPI00189C66A5|nr:phenylalanine--tRNA ligase beta subunit-related protein [Alkalibacter mobilis]MBF7096272.1 hypothetical protein [Alkalibacter mobilis]